jgi:hypothetical protein
MAGITRRDFLKQAGIMAVLGLLAPRTLGRLLAPPAAGSGLPSRSGNNPNLAHLLRPPFSSRPPTMPF